MGWWGTSTETPAQEQWREWLRNPEQVVYAEIVYMGRNRQWGYLEEQVLRTAVPVRELKMIAELIWTDSREAILEMSLDHRLRGQGLLEIQPRDCVSLWAAELAGRPGRYFHADLECWIAKGFRDERTPAPPFWRD